MGALIRMGALTSMDSFNSIFAVIFVLALLGLTLAWLRKRGAAVWRNPLASGSQRQLEIVERVAVGAQQALCLVRVGGQCVLISVSPAGCRLLPVSVSARSKERQV